MVKHWPLAGGQDYTSASRGERAREVGGMAMGPISARPLKLLRDAR